MNKILIIGTSDFVFPYNKYGKTGRVHSIFSNSLNLVVNHQLIHISDSEQFLSGFGIQISQDDFRKLRQTIHVGELVTFKEESIVIYGSAKVSQLYFFLNKTQLIEQKIRKISYSFQEIKSLQKVVRIALDNRLIGLDDNPKFQNIQKQLTTGILTKQKIDSVVTYLIGRGLGLTPSGDDLLLGYAVGLEIFDSFPIVEVLKNYQQFWSPRTTNVSKAYLDSFLESRVSSPVFRFNQAIYHKNEIQIKNSLQVIQEIGHTSGVDFLFGFLLSLHYIDQKNENARITQ
ncbi:DUF2877 domain-containing protein [Streptococcus pluranimalium]|uniref:DUF2877 domain-containing protein n=1 Tax=Streptococcus pluranimalium TaxID=82348 RepID=UPI003F692680